MLYQYDPRTSARWFADNTQVGAFMAKTLGVDLDVTTNRLFQDAAVTFANKGASISEDFRDAENPVLVVSKDNQTLRIPRKQECSLAQRQSKVQSDGVTVYNGSRWFCC